MEQLLNSWLAEQKPASADLIGLSLEVDLQGIQLTHEGEAREQEEKKAS